MMLIPMQQPRHELAALIERVRELNDWSDMDVVRRATAHGHPLSKSNLSRIRNTPVVSLTGSTIKGLAAGLGIAETEIARAALVSMGIDMPDLGGLDLETVIKMDTSISAHNRSMLLGLVRQMRRPDLEDGHGTGTEEEQKSRTQESGPEHSSAPRGNRRRPGAPMMKSTTLHVLDNGHESAADHEELPPWRAEDEIAAFDPGIPD